MGRIVSAVEVKLGAVEPAPTVWVVEKGYPYEGNSVEAVFSSELLALRYIAALASAGTGGAEYTYGQMPLDPAPPKVPR